MSKYCPIDWGIIVGWAIIAMALLCFVLGMERQQILQEKADCLAKGGTWVTLRKGDIEGRCVVVKEQKP